MTTPATERIYRVPEQNLGDLQNRIQKIARRCNRIHIAPPVLVIGASEDIRIPAPRGSGEPDSVRRMYSVTLTSVERPKIEGHEFLAVLAPITDESGTLLGNILRAVPGASVTPEERFRTASNYCDHCKTNRFRLETFVITDGTTQRQIGRNCLANYLGLTNPHQLAAIAQMLIDIDELAGMAENEGGFGGGSYSTRFPLDSVLEVAASAIRNYGWLSGASARTFDRTSTSTRVNLWMTGAKKVRDDFEHPLEITEADQKLAAETEEWLGTITDTTNDYMYNLSLLAQASSIEIKNLGIVVSAINAYSRAKEREIRRNARIESDKSSEFVGTVGERISFANLLVVYTNTFESDFGVTYLYKMKTGDNVVVYFSSRDLGFEQGTIIPVFVARVKKHEVREEVKQTVITRGTIPPRKLSKEEKRATNKLKRILKTLPYDQETFLAHKILDELIADIKQNGLEVQTPSGGSNEVQN